MATLSQIKTRILTKCQSLSTKKDELEFLYEVQERLQIKHNEKGAEFTSGDITEEEWKIFKGEWTGVSKEVGSRLADIREEVFVNDYNIPDADTREHRDMISVKKLSLKESLKYKSNINTIWQ